MSGNPEETTHFGFRDVPVAEKKPMVRAVFDSVARKYDVMNDLMSLRLWKGDLITMIGAPKGTGAFHLLDLAGGTGDVALRWLQAGGGPAILSDINESMLTVGRDRLLGKGHAANLSFLVADAEALPLPDRAVDTVSMAFGLRNCTD